MYSIVYNGVCILKGVNKNGNRLSKKETGVLRAIRNHLIDVVNPSVRQLMKEFEYKSPSSISIYIDNLIRRDGLKRKSDTTLQL